MNELVPINRELRRSPSRAERATARAVERVRGEQAVRAAEETARIEVIAEVTETALLATSHVSALESFLMDRTPHAEGRLKRIADAGALGMSSVVLQATRRCQ